MIGECSGFDRTVLREGPAIKKIMTPPKLGLKNMLVVAFRIVLTLDVNIVYFGCQGAVHIITQQKFKLLGVVNFKSALSKTDTLHLFSLL